MKNLLAMLTLAGALVGGMAPGAGAAAQAPSIKVREAVVSRAGVTLYITINGVQRKCGSPTTIEPQAAATDIRSSLTIKCPNGSMTAHLWTDHIMVVIPGRTLTCATQHEGFGWVVDGKRNITRLYEEWRC